MSEDKQTGVIVQLTGEDGNAVKIIGKVKKALRRAGYSKEFVDQYVAEATSGSYDNLLMVTMEYVDVQ